MQIPHLYQFCSQRPNIFAVCSQPEYKWTGLFVSALRLIKVLFIWKIKKNKLIINILAVNVENLVGRERCANVFSTMMKLKQVSGHQPCWQSLNVTHIWIYTAVSVTVVRISTVSSIRLGCVHHCTYLLWHKKIVPMVKKRSHNDCWIKKVCMPKCERKLVYKLKALF